MTLGFTSQSMIWGVCSIPPSSNLQKIHTWYKGNRLENHNNTDTNTIDNDMVERLDYIKMSLATKSQRIRSQVAESQVMIPMWQLSIYNSDRRCLECFPIKMQICQVKWTPVKFTPGMLNAQRLHLMHMSWGVPFGGLSFQGDAFLFKEVPLYDAFR